MNSPTDDNRHTPRYGVISANDLYVINEEVTGYTAFVRDKQLLHSAVRRPYIVLFGQEQFPTIIEKAAATLHAVASYHIFGDGNKRTALRATELFLDVNNIQMNCNPAEAQAFVLEIAKGTIDVEAVTEWLQEHTQETE